MKIMILAAIAAIGLGVAVANAERATAYHAPAHNFYQNNWMADD